jgi:mono/diheme cytochrome c family protein
LSRNDVILTVFAALLVGFSLVVSLLVPRTRPGFPGRSLRLFGAMAALLVVAMLASVEVFGEAHHFGEGHAEEPQAPGETGTTETGTTQTETTQTETGAGETTTGGGEEPRGDPAAGEQVFAAQGCGSCHTLSAASATGQVGPNLDEGLQGRDPEFIRMSIVDPNAEITEGFQAGIMPQNYEQQLSPKQLDDLVAFLAHATSG